MIDADLLDILVCPETHQPLRLADPALMDALNRRVEERQLRNRSGHLIPKPLDQALVREDGKWLYPVMDGLPVLLVDEAIAMPHSKDCLWGANLKH